VGEIYRLVNDGTLRHLSAQLKSYDDIRLK
jgi:hypothetical protein